MLTKRCLFQLLNAVGQVRRAVTVMPDISNLHINNGKQPFLLTNSFPCTIKCFIFNISVDFFKVFYKPYVKFIFQNQDANILQESLDFMHTH